jgi:hypothetical protein
VRGDVLVDVSSLPWLWDDRLSHGYIPTLTLIMKRLFPFLSLRRAWALSVLVMLPFVVLGAEETAEVPETKEIVHDELVMFGQDLVLNKNEVA